MEKIYLLQHAVTKEFFGPNGEFGWDLSELQDDLLTLDQANTIIGYTTAPLIIYDTTASGKSKSKKIQMPEIIPHAPVEKEMIVPAMILTKNEETLIKALIEMNEIPTNMLLWYTSGLEASVAKIENVLGKDSSEAQNRNSIRRIEIANRYQRENF